MRSRGLLDTVDALDIEDLAMLGLDQTASQHSILRAYVSRALSYYPPTWMVASDHERQSAQSQFCELATAYEKLATRQYLATLPMTAALAVFARAALQDVMGEDRVRSASALIAGLDPRPRLGQAQSFRDACVAVALALTSPREFDKLYTDLNREQRYEFLEIVFAMRSAM